jgi:O-antigen/teichoic acid export membrane protein
VSRIVASFVVLCGGESIGKILALAAFAYLARILEPEAFGHLEFTLAIMFLFTLAVDCGLGPYGAREIAKDNGVVVRFVLHVVFVRAFLAVAACTCVAILVALIDKPWSVKQLLLLYGITLLCLPGFIPWVFQGCGLMQYVALASIIRWSVFAAGVLLFIQGPAQLWIVPVIEGSAIICAVSFYLWCFARAFNFRWKRPEYGFALSLLRQAWPIGGAELVWAVKIYFATVWLGIFLEGSEVAWFGAAHRSVIALHTFVWLYFFNLLPALARSTAEPLESLHQLLHTSIQVAAWSAVFLGAVGTFFAEPFIALLYGPPYHEAAMAFRVLIWLIPLTLLSGHYRYALIAYNRQRLEFLSAACGAGLNVILSIGLIPSYGGLGAAWALLVSELLIWCLTYYFVRHTITDIPIWPHLPRPVIGGVLLASVLYCLPSINLWAMMSATVGVCCLILFVMQPSLINDLRLICSHHRS